MIYHLEVSLLARADLAEASDWYKGIRPNLESDLILCVEETLGRICDNPNAYRTVLPGVRYARIRRFPYGILYRLKDLRIEVEGVFHARRDQRHLQARAEKE